MATLTAHCIVANEEHFITDALLSVIDFVDAIIVFDTGSTDTTVSMVQAVAASHPGKIIFEQKGSASFERHTTLRQEMIDRTTTDWFMILDGDEVWTERAMREAQGIIQAESQCECIIAPFYLCVGDPYHYSARGAYTLRGITTHATPRFFARHPGVHWSGAYNADAIEDANGQRVFEKEPVEWLQNKFWHVSHLNRSSASATTYSSGGTRARKYMPTYWLIGKPIREQPPEILSRHPTPYNQHRSATNSFINFWPWAIRRALLKIVS